MSRDRALLGLLFDRLTDPPASDGLAEVVHSAYAGEEQVRAVLAGEPVELPERAEGAMRYHRMLPAGRDGFRCRGLVRGGPALAATRRSRLGRWAQRLRQGELHRGDRAGADRGQPALGGAAQHSPRRLAQPARFVTLRGRADDTPVRGRSGRCRGLLHVATEQIRVGD